MEKKIWSYSIAIAIVFGVYAVANRVSAQMIAGGYGSTSASSKEVKRAAQFAVRQHSSQIKSKLRLVEIVKAEQQVVAGMNYRLVLRVSDKRGRKRMATAVVYQDLKNHLSLTSWTATDHGE